MAPCSTYNDVDSSVHSAWVMIFFFVHTLILHKAYATKISEIICAYNILSNCSLHRVTIMVTDTRILGFSLTLQIWGSLSICNSYLVDWAWPFIVMDMAVEGNVNLVLLPKFLQTIPSHRLFICALLAVPVIRWISKDTMSGKDQPRLPMSIYRCKALLNKPVLFWSFSPVVFTVSYAEVK